ncbi:general secretion pathway protein E (Type II traffic warden ATPase) [Aromatoleum aromaticum EbN1]|uniref:Type II secretion system protein E n=1 Tax=Aromatoleum aromaticum (strain DSM 19018 / LMG 30748 / EbN1) TaxID=76114 RepID=Q5P6Q4_AROAE|nr:type II secretion system ATPase GspE [Aromatoleum aromaticum]CAI07007.1 general secretion pathway protein E (Type II traffic warden ATPase) [Aromatoleum aromaticum EbN1]
MQVDSAADRPRLGELLVREGKLSQRDLEQALIAQQEMGDLLGRVLIRLGLLSEIDIARTLSGQLDIPLVQAGEFPEEMVVVEGLSSEYLLSQGVLPWRREADELHVVMAVPQDGFLTKALHLATGLRIRPALGLESDIQAALDRLYLEAASPDDEEDEGFVGALGSDNEFIEHLKDLASEAPVIRLVTQIIGRVIDLRASDIHIEPFEDGLHVRYRVDGVLQAAESAAPSLGAAVTSRIKLLAHLNIAERRLPQDGRIRTRVKGHELDLRVSTLPTVHGESVVMRVLDRASIRISLEDMGFAEDNLARFRDLLLRPHGILLVTGPTGSGKTTTLYAALAKLDATELKILTVEDPVEYQLAGVNQVQVQSQIGLSFAHALRSILRQDPDIIMIGEMRDTETAQIAVQSALTGHLVLSTLHTNTAVGAIVRLEDMGVERYLITSTVNGVLSQRLVRKLCEHCREAVELHDAELDKAGIARFLPEGERRVFAARGCPRCKHTGYHGRTSIHELFVMDDAAHQAVLSGADATILHNVARRAGMLTLYEDGLRKVAAGVTSMDELLRVTQDQSND